MSNAKATCIRDNNGPNDKSSPMGNGENIKYGSVDSIFALCKTCHWCATFFDKSRVPNNKCPTCGNTSISTFPILPNEEFTFDYNEKRGVDLEFGLKKKGKNKDNERRQ